MIEASVVSKLTKDVRQSVTGITLDEARYLVSAYYIMQDYRIRSAAQERELSKAEKPNEAIAWLEAQNESLEHAVKRLLDAWTDSQPMGQWAKAITGIGPVLSAGLLAHIDITKAPTAGHIWRFAGLDPTSTWDKGQKRPWNAELKVLCFKLGESFVKVQRLEHDVYGKLYAQRKQQEQAKNEAGDFAEQAKQQLTAKKFRADTVARGCYERGQLPPAHLHARARRYAVKIFLSHWHAEAYRQHYGTEPPAPYPIAILRHAHRI